MNRRSAEPERLGDAAPQLGRDDVTVLVVDDHPVFRDVMREMVAATPGFTVVGEACSGNEALRASEALSPQFVLMDVRMPDGDGVEAARRLLRLDPDLVVLLVSAQELPDPLPRDLSVGISLAQKWDLRGALLRETWEGRKMVR